MFHHETLPAQQQYSTLLNYSSISPQRKHFMTKSIHFSEYNFMNRCYLSYHLFSLTISNTAQVFQPCNRSMKTTKNPNPKQCCEKGHVKSYRRITDLKGRPRTDFFRVLALGFFPSIFSKTEFQLLNCI